MATVIKTLTVTTDDSGLQALVDDANVSIAKINDLSTEAAALVTEIEGKLATIASFQSSVDVQVADGPNASAAQ